MFVFKNILKLFNFYIYFKILIEIIIIILKLIIILGGLSLEAFSLKSLIY